MASNVWVKVHTAPDGSKWINNADQWVRYDSQIALQQMDVDSPRAMGNLRALVLPPIQDHHMAPYHYFIHPVSAGPSTAQYGPSSQVPSHAIDPCLLSLPNNGDPELGAPSDIAKANGLKPAQKVSGSRQVNHKGKKCAHSPDSDYDMPVAKCGRPVRSANDSNNDVHKLLNAAAKHLPLGNKGWNTVHQDFDKYCQDTNCMWHDIKSVEGKFKQLVKTKKPTGAGIRPPHVKRALEIDAAINEKAGTHDLSNGDGEDFGFSAESSDGEDQIKGTTLQQHLNDAERACDMALLELKMTQQYSGRGDRDECHRIRSNYCAERSRSPHHNTRCEVQYPDGGACTYWVSDGSDSDKENEGRHHRPHHTCSPTRTQIYFCHNDLPAFCSPSARPSCSLFISQPFSTCGHSLSSVRPVTPSMRGSTIHPNEPTVSVVTGAGGVELTVTPSRAGRAPVSFVIRLPRTKQQSTEASA
ncbi:hypothetical protein B0H19DRAFT_1309927 [Mycena capillaripes]|nr:hypothetical protein B0H19DRAFT_1309927 [Mycena capillaripes]